MSTSFYVYETQAEPKGDNGMRAIKFRGKSVMAFEELAQLGIDHENGWVKGNLIVNGNRPYIVGGVIETSEDFMEHEFWVRVIQRTIGQFTGLKDKNGKEIYEGDVLHYCIEEWPGGDYREREEKRVVSFVDGCFWLVSDKGDDPLYAVHAADDEMEIIGNRFDIPELLEVTN